MSSLYQECAQYDWRTLKTMLETVQKKIEAFGWYDVLTLKIKQKYNDET